MDAISLAGFGFAYPGCDPVLHGIDARIGEGSFTLLVGSTGSGKTTLLRCLKPELAPAGERFGEAEVLGKALPVPGGSGADAATVSQIGYVAQNPENQIICDVVWHELAFGLENLGTPQETMHRRVAEVACFFGMEPWFRRDAADLSGGQKQMLNLASVLVMQPRLLLLDEPTSQLDPVAAKNFLHLLFRVNRELGITVLVTTHAPESMAEYATDCLRMDGGVLRREGLDGFREDGATASQRVRPLDPLPEAPRRGPGMRGVFFRYSRDAAWVLRGATLDVAAGSIHALVGGNGSGKTTALKLMAGILKPERGRASNDLLREQALLPQDPRALFACDAVIDELREWGSRCGYGDDEVADALAWAGLRGFEQHHPYDLSGGQQQKLALAKVLLTGPRLLLLDEPTKGLDPLARLETARILAELRSQGATIVISTHDLSFALNVADRVSMIFDGQVTCTEDAPAFFARNLFYRPARDGFCRLLAGEAASAREADDDTFRDGRTVFPKVSS